jgi:hypothetical protein
MKAAPRGMQTGLAFTTGGIATGGTFRNPSWSPDGTRVVYHRPDFTARPQNQPLYSWDPETDYRYTDVFPQFSKDGRLAISQLNNLATPQAAIAVMSADGFEPARRLFRQSGACVRADLVARRPVDRVRRRRLLRRA